MLTDEFLHTVAQAPGVYLMEDSGGTVLYVGKAKNLRKRLTTPPGADLISLQSPSAGLMKN